MKPICSYSKVYAIGHRAISNLFEDSVLVEEKIDGSQFSFGIIKNKLMCRSRNCMIDFNNPGMFGKAIETIKEIESLLHEDWIYRGEYLSKPKHNTLVYDRVPQKNLILFDIDTNGLMNYIPYDKKKIEVEYLGLECVPKLYEGEIKNIDEFLDLLEIDSCLGGQKVEGIVCKNYNKFTPDGKTVMGKYVREDFKEKHDKNWKAQNKNRKDILELIGATYRSEARWEKAIQHLKERGELLGEPKDIGNLMKEIQQDIKEECKEEIAEKLFDWAWKQIYKKFTAGFPQWYKEKLAKKSFK